MFWKKLNNKNVLNNAKAMVKLVENNQHAELLLDRIKEVEHRYETTFAAENRYRILIEEMMNHYNSRIKFPDYHHLELIETELLSTFGIKGNFLVSIANRYQRISEEVTQPMLLLEQSIARYNPREIAYMKLFHKIIFNGMDELFTNKKLEADQYNLYMNYGNW